MTGTLGRALEVRGVPSHPEKLSADVEGDIEDVDGVMKIARIRIGYKIRHPAGKRPEVERALAVHERGCPAAMTLRDAVALEWSATFEEEPNE